MTERAATWTPAPPARRQGRLAGWFGRSGSGMRTLARNVDPHVVGRVRPTSFEAGRYRSLCHSLERREESQGWRVLAISSPAVGDGKTTTALNLAATLAQSPNSDVLLVDADLRRGNAARRLVVDRPAGAGLSEFLADESLPPEKIVQRSAAGPWVIAAGRADGDPYSLLRSPRFADLIAEARRRYDRVVIDCPPILLVPDWQVLSSMTDGWMLVVRANRTPRKLVEESLRALEAECVFGLVMNAEDRPLSGYYRGLDPYGYPPDGELQSRRS
jgi:capsular exopolysaccharide synthesis family protein